MVGATVHALRLLDNVRDSSPDFNILYDAETGKFSMIRRATGTKFDDGAIIPTAYGHLYAEHTAMVSISCSHFARNPS